jgi:hypothetical protein
MPRPEFKDLPFYERPDLTPYLVHLTRNTKKEDGFSAFENLVSILEHGQIWGSDQKKGFIQGPHSAACLMDVPFASLKYFFKAKTVRYEPFGIFVSKKYAYEKGCRPVLYLSKDETKNKLRISNDELWRVVKFEVNKDGWISWLHEREWRCKGDLSLPTNPYGILVRHSNDAERLEKMIRKSPDKFKIKPRSIIPLSVMCQGLR